jgi:molecular chaperone DnaK
MILGIDLGATNTVGCVWDGKLRMIEITSGGATSLPSVVTIANGEALVGQAAIEAGRQFPDYQFRLWKRTMAERWHEDEDTGYQTCRGEDGMLAYRGPDGFTYSPIELSALIIAEIVRAANEYLAPHDSVTGAVIGIPATFTPDQIEAVKTAAKMAGLDNNVTTLEEPVAAAIAGNIDRKKSDCSLVVDFGGSTLDVTILRAGGGLIKVLAKNGIGDLGGADFDSRIAQYVTNLFRTEHKRDLQLRDAAMTRLLVEAEAVKKRLTDNEETTFRVENLDRTAEGVSLHAIYKIDRRIFNELTRDLQERVLAAVKAAIEDAKRQDAKFRQADIKSLLLVGGMTRIPSIRTIVSDATNLQPNKSENPEMVVAQGLAIKGAIIEGRKPDVSIADITSHDIALETTNNVPAIVIPRGSSFPMEKTLVLSNADDDQTEISVRLLYATRPRAQDCHLLEAREIPVEPAPAETLRVKVTIAVNDEGHPSLIDAA